MSIKGRYATPFHVENDVIYDADGKKVKLWGVNYYAPFNHNYYNIEELGKDHFAAIDEDIRHFRCMGVEFIRMHLYEREITDREGNIVENHNMKVFDYLVDECEKNGIYLMITPVVWWNTINNEMIQERYYAYWHIDAQEAFGFTNYYSCDSMLWDPDAIKCQQTYFEGLFSRGSTVSGRRLDEYDNVVVIEPFNEPRYPERWMLEEVEITPANMGRASLSRGRQRLKLVGMWEDFRNAHSDVQDEDECFSMFRLDVLKKYFDSMLPIIDKYFGRKVLKAQFTGYSGVIPQDLKKLFIDAGFDACTLGTYLNVNGFDSANTDSANHLAIAEKWFGRIDGVDYSGLAKISYEFDASATQNGYPLAAIAAMYAKYDVQMTAYFTYTPAAVAAWNPGWLVHYLSMEHTPSRAAGFAAAGEIFRNHNPGDKLAVGTEEWGGEDYRIVRENDLVTYKSDNVFRYSFDNDEELGDASKLELVSGRGASRFASSSGNGIYLLEKLSDTEWGLSIFSSQKYVCDPQRGKSYRSMANRYVNCVKEPPVSLLLEDEIEFRLKAFTVTSACEKHTQKAVEVGEGGVMKLRAGEYILEVKS